MKMTILEYYASRLNGLGFDFSIGEQVDKALHVYNPTDLPEMSNARRFYKWNLETGLFEIWINSFYLGTKEETGIILHELIHTFPDCWNHGCIFKFYRDAIEYNFGVKIPYIDEETLKQFDERMSRAKYIIRCTTCGVQSPRFRRCKVVKKPWNYRCPHCGGWLNAINTEDLEDNLSSEIC